MRFGIVVPSTVKNRMIKRKLLVIMLIQEISPDTWWPFLKMIYLDIYILHI